MWMNNDEHHQMNKLSRQRIRIVEVCSIVCCLLFVGFFLYVSEVLRLFQFVAQAFFVGKKIDIVRERLYRVSQIGCLPYVFDLAEGSSRL